MIWVGLVLLAVGLVLMLLVPEPTVSMIGRICVIFGAILLVVGLIVYGLDADLDVHSVILLR